MEEGFKQAVEHLHQCHASFLEDVALVEKFGKETGGTGIVSVFLITGHPQADKRYAWSSPLAGGTERKYYAILHIPPVASPKKQSELPLFTTLREPREESMNNILIHADNYDGLVYLAEKKGMRGKIRLVYIDPPYGTNQTFTVSNKRFATVSRANGGKLAYDDTLTGEDYLRFLGERLVLIRDLMAQDGSIYVHIDIKMGHYVKCLMDKIFGQKNFINDITRIKCNPKNFSRKGYGNMKDMILFYSKGLNYVWNEPRQPIDIDTDPRFKSIDKNGRRYTTTPLHAPGETVNGATGKKWRDLSPPPGRHWRYPPEVLEELDRNHLIEWSSTGNPRKIIYADEIAKNGVKFQDIWTFKDPQNARYPTEKNLDMLRMMVKASSNEGDWVLDAFAGAGTTLLAAQELKRHFIGIDSSNEAINLTVSRLTNCTLIDLRKYREDERIVEKKHCIL